MKLCITVQQILRIAFRDFGSKYLQFLKNMYFNFTFLLITLKNVVVFIINENENN